MPQSLSSRQKTYENAYDYEIIRRVPIIVRLDGRSFSSVTRKLTKPFCEKLSGLMTESMKNVAKEIDGCVFGYQQSDEITFILRNDQSLVSEPWFNNRIQKIVSISASLLTYEFNELYASVEDAPELIGPCIFDARVFAVPSLHEAINNLVFRQQDCIRNAISSAALVELGRVHGRKAAMRMVHGKSVKEKIEILKEHEIDIEQYPAKFRKGVALYRAPKVVGGVTRQKWILDDDLPIFAGSDFVKNILESGRDIFRANRDIADGNTTEEKF